VPTTARDTVQVIEDEARRLLAAALEGEGGIIASHRRELEALVDELLAVESVDSDRLRELLGDPGRAREVPSASPLP